MPTISTLNSIAIANVSSYSTRTKASISTINGITVPNGGATPATYGYSFGGATTVYIALTDRITYSTGAFAANTTSNSTITRGENPAGISDKVTYGYYLGGYSSARTAQADRLTFSTSTTAANTASNLSQARYWVLGISDGATYGYALGGNTANRVATADRVTFSTSATAANTASNLSVARANGGGMSDGVTYGYYSGGWTNGATEVTTGDRITYSTSATAANTASNLSQARAWTSGLSDGVTYGYVLGGRTGNADSTVQVTGDRLTFSTSTIAANTTSNLSVAKSNYTCLSDGVTYGYIPGGYNTSGTRVSTTDRITFSTSTTAAATASALSLAKGMHGGVSDFSI